MAMSGTGGHGRRRAAGGGGGTAAIAAMLHGTSTETPAPTLAPSQNDFEVMLNSMVIRGLDYGNIEKL